MSEEKLSVRLEARAAEMDRRLGATDVQALLREAAQLARRVEGAPATILATCHTDDGIELAAQVPADAPGTWCSGQRVRLVREA